MKFRIRYNKTAGQPGRGTVDHKWRVFDEVKEYICKKVMIKVPCETAEDPNGVDCNIICEGEMKIHKENSIIEII